jgi:hypothetical protein
VTSLFSQSRSDSENRIARRRRERGGDGREPWAETTDVSGDLGLHGDAAAAADAAPPPPGLACNRRSLHSVPRRPCLSTLILHRLLLADNIDYGCSWLADEFEATS